MIDFSPLNKHAPRQTHHTRSPYQIAASVPGNKIKSVLDNWHGYHSVPLDPSDRPLTTFLTPYGRYRYKTAPQGYLACQGPFDDIRNRYVELLPSVFREYSSLHFSRMPAAAAAMAEVAMVAPKCGE